MAQTTLFVTIPAGQALSPPLPISPILRIVRIVAPGAWDAAPISFQISSNDIDYRDLFHVAQTPQGGWMTAEVVVPSAAPNSTLHLPPNAGFGLGGLKIRSGTRSQPVNQTADRKFAIVCG